MIDTTSTSFFLVRREGMDMLSVRTVADYVMRQYPDIMDFRQSAKGPGWFEVFVRKDGTLTATDAADIIHSQILNEAHLAR